MPSIAKAFDIATGYFEIGALLALDGEVAEARQDPDPDGRRGDAPHAEGASRGSALHEPSDASTRASRPRRTTNPFLDGVPAIVEALRSGKIECRVYDKDKFHAKAYITHAKLEVVGSQALVGSSNFTAPGPDREHRAQHPDPERARGRAAPGVVRGALERGRGRHRRTILETIERHIATYTPFDVYAKALQEFFRGHELTATEWDETRSKMFPELDRYQKEAYWALMKIARQHGGAFLCDGVGLGKTFVGLMLIERLVLHEGKRVVLFAPKAAKEGVWEPHLREWLPHIGGVGGGADFSNLAVFSHTDLGRKGDFPERFRRIAELADVVIIDEATTSAIPGDGATTTDRIEPSRYYRLYDLLDNAVRPKTLFMLTATPINNRLSDFRHMAELFTRRDEAYFARTLGVNNLRAHFNNMEKALRSAVGHDVDRRRRAHGRGAGDPGDDEIFQQLVVQRSRAYARESQIRETGKAAVFPERKPPQVAEYSIRKTYGRLLDMFEKAFTRKNPLFTLADVLPAGLVQGAGQEHRPVRGEPAEAGRRPDPDQLPQALREFRRRIRALLRPPAAEAAGLPRGPQRDRRREEAAGALEDPERRDPRLRTQAPARALGRGRRRAEDEDIVPQEMLDAVERLDREEYDVDEMMTETFLDLDQIVHFLDEARKFEPKHDDKLQKLIRLLKSKELAGQKVLIFTEFADTARYLQAPARRGRHRRRRAGRQRHQGQPRRRHPALLALLQRHVLGRRSPRRARTEIRVLISTDVLSEGLNLQDASRLINYDIHWNPVRLMQRIGRVDRRMNPEVEKRLVADHPEVASSAAR